MAAEEFLKRLLLVSALLAGEFDAGRALCGRDAIWRAAFSAGSLDPGIALLHDNGLARHGFADQALGFLAHRLLRHSLAPVMRTSCVIAPMLPLATGLLVKKCFFQDRIARSRNNSDSIFVRTTAFFVTKFQVKLHLQQRDFLTDAVRTI